MNKSDLIKSVSEQLSTSNAKAEQAVRIIFDQMSLAMSKGEDVVIYGFGTFTVKPTDARTGRNPQTGEPMDIPAGKRVKFNLAKALKDALR